MLKKLAPQKVADDKAGYALHVVDRYHVEYSESDRRAIVDVDFGTVIGIYRDTLTDWITTTGTYAMSDNEKKIVLSRINEALQFMGSRTEFC